MAIVSLGLCSQLTTRGRKLLPTHRLSLAALVTPGAWSVATMHTALARSAFASCRTRRVGATVVRRVQRGCGPVLQKHILPRSVVFFKPSAFHQLVGFYVFDRLSTFSVPFFGFFSDLAYLVNSRWEPDYQANTLLRYG